METLAQNLADALARELSLEKRDRDIAAYALHGLFSVGFYTILLLLVAWGLGVLTEAGAVALTVAVFRTFMGGAHLATAWRCGISAAAVMTALGFIGRALAGISGVNTAELQVAVVLLLAVLSLWAIGRFCPADVPQKPITHPVHRRNLRIVARVLLGLWVLASLYLIRSSAASLYWSSALGLAQQLLMVTPAGFGLCRQLDGLVEFISTKGGGDQR